LPFWLWVLFGIIGFLAVSLLVGLLVAAILANIGREFSALLEFEPLKSAPLRDAPESTSETVRKRPVRTDPGAYGSSKPR
jgi:hypothetical protein